MQLHCVNVEVLWSAILTIYFSDHYRQVNWEAVGVNSVILITCQHKHATAITFQGFYTNFRWLPFSLYNIKSPITSWLKLKLNLPWHCHETRNSHCPQHLLTMDSDNTNIPLKPVPRHLQICSWKHWLVKPHQLEQKSLGPPKWNPKC